MALLRYALIACLVGLVLPACTQDENEACQVNTDCADGLICVGADGVDRGTCLPPDREGMTEDNGDDEDGDASVDENVAIPDSGEDDAG